MQLCAEHTQLKLYQCHILNFLSRTYKTDQGSDFTPKEPFALRKLFVNLAPNIFVIFLKVILWLLLTFIIKVCECMRLWALTEMNTPRVETLVVFRGQWQEVEIAAWLLSLQHYAHVCSSLKKQSRNRKANVLFTKDIVH